MLSHLLNCTTGSGRVNSLPGTAGGGCGEFKKAGCRWVWVNIKKSFKCDFSGDLRASCFPVYHVSRLKSCSVFLEIPPQRPPLPPSHQHSSVCRFGLQIGLRSPQKCPVNQNPTEEGGKTPSAVILMAEQEEPNLLISDLLITWQLYKAAVGSESQRNCS